MKITILFLAMLAVSQVVTTQELLGSDPSWVGDGGNGRFLGSRRVQMTCNKYPRVCRMAGSPGPDCCKKSCVNVMSDKANCGMCGNKCRYAEICCKGTCVRPASDRRNCGGCGSKCKKGIACEYGICSYA